MRTYRALYEEGLRLLEGAGVEEAGLDARLLLEHVCGTDRNDLLVHGDRAVSAKREARYLDLVGRRAGRIPLQQLTGVQQFMGLEFAVNEHVLIPRQDTEILVEEVLKELHDGMRILDLCTGSGCILISLLHYSNRCSGVGVDLSREALRLAGRNAERLLQGREELHLLQGDLFAPLRAQHPSPKFEFIVSNPPYIRSAVCGELMPEVREHEPRMALDGGEDGLDFYRRITAEAHEYLAGGGRLYFEIGYDQAEDVAALMQEAGYVEIHVVKDYAGLDRVVYGTYIIE